MVEPKVRFKQDNGSSFPAWQTIPMSEVFTEITEKNHSDMPVLSVQQGVGTVLRDSSDRNILYDKSNLKGYKAMKKNDYIIHLRSFEGGLECSNYDGISSPAYRILRPQTILPAAYRDYFRSYEFIHNKLAVSVVGIRDGKNIDMDTFWQIPMNVPCLEEQQKIADFLSSVDEVITASEQEVANLETQKKAVMKKIFSQEVRFKREDGTDFPEWEEKTLGEVCEPLQYGMNAAACEYDGQNKYIRITDIDDSTHAYLKDNIVSPTGELSDKYLVSKGDILLARTGASSGKSYLYNENDGRMYFAGFLIRAHVKDGYDDYFIYSQTLTYAYDKWVKLTSQRSGQPGINAEEYAAYVLHVPCLEEQRLIADFFSNFDEAIAAAKKELELWKELKRGLLQQMFV